jgi:hypothetical protein
LLNGEVYTIDREIVTEGANQIVRGNGVGHLPKAIGGLTAGFSAIVLLCAQREYVQVDAP